jgi:hypothetical protein
MAGAPVDGVTWKMAREEFVGANSDWYQLVVADEYKGRAPDWARTLKIPCST